MSSTQEQISIGAIFLTPQQMLKRIQKTEPTDFAQRMADQRYLSPIEFDRVQRYEPKESPRNNESINNVPDYIKTKLKNIIGVEEILAIKSITCESFEFIDWTKMHFNSNFYCRLSGCLFDLFRETFKHKGIGLPHHIRIDKEFFLNPNYLIDSKFKYKVIFDEYLKWLHGDNRTI